VTSAIAALAWTSAAVPESSRLPPLPERGSLLVEAPPFGLAVVEHAGDVRRLGEFYDAAWSPDGASIVAVRGRRLVVLSRRGEPRWSRRTPTAPALQPDWAPDSRALAYRGGASLRLIGADGRRDRAVARGLGFAGPRWRPVSGREVAWADRRGRVRLLDVVADRNLWSSEPGRPLRPDGLEWSPDGSMLAAISGSEVRLLDSAHGHLLWRLRARGTDRFQMGTFTRSEPSLLALSRHDFTRGGSLVMLLDPRRGAASARELFARRGRVVDVTSSPDGRWLLLGWRGGDQWRFISVAGAPAVTTNGVTRALNPSAGGRWAFPTVRGWCCSAG
jgi:hypothetical protein